jgi:hypothetical protein
MGCRRSGPGPLTPRMVEIVEFVRNYSDQHGYPPSTLEMARALRVRPVWALRLAHGAVDRGALTHTPGVARSWRLPTATGTKRG